MAKQLIMPPDDLVSRLEYMKKVRTWNDGAIIKRKVYVQTFGCQQNEADSEKYLGMAVDMGYEPTDTPDNADLIIVNTCAIREHAEKKALSIIGQYKHIKARNKDLIIGVCGCMVAQEHRREELKMKYPYVTFTLGTASLHHLPRVLWETIDTKRRLITNDSVEDFTETVAESMPIRRGSGYRAWVSIMYGCNNFCSYCIVPYVRGRERSRNKEDIIAEVKTLVAEGYKDITLLGQNVNSYGKGTDTDFADLLSELDTIEGDYWLRFMTSHPKDASHKLIDVMAKGKHIAHQFHLPLQSGSDPILKAMNRHYDMERYMDSIHYMRKCMPDVTITSDIIVGFPGETEEQFEETLKALTAVRFDMLYSFIYSPRKGTPAAEREQIPDTVKGNRFDRLLTLQNEIGYERNLLLMGRCLRVLCDGVSKGDDSVYSGRTEGNKIVFFKGTPDMVGQFVTVTVKRVEPFALWGEIETMVTTKDQVFEIMGAYYGNTYWRGAIGCTSEESLRLITEMLDKINALGYHFSNLHRLTDHEDIRFIPIILEYFPRISYLSAFRYRSYYQYTPELIKIYKDPKYEYMRWNITNALLAIRHKKFIPQYLELVNDPGYGAKSDLVMEILCRFKVKEALPRLLELYQRYPDRWRWTLLKYGWYFKDHSITPYIEPYLTCDDGEYRQMAKKAIKKLTASE